MANFSTGYIFGFAGALCLVCGLAVAGATLSLREKQEVNKLRDMRGSILSALDLPGDGKVAKGEEIDRLWADRVELVYISPKGKVVTGDASQDQDGDGDLDEDDLDAARAEVKGTDNTPDVLAVYTRKDGKGGNKVGAYAIPVYGNGLWGPISGYIALKPNATEVMGATFFAPKETPGLGAEIMETPFESKWVGKKVATKKGKAKAIDVGKGCAKTDPHCVDGVSGATITSRGVDAMVEQAIENHYKPYLAKVRGKKK